MLIKSISGRNGTQFSNALLHHRKKSILITFQGNFFCHRFPPTKNSLQNEDDGEDMPHLFRVFWRMRKPQVANATGCLTYDLNSHWFKRFVKVIPDKYLIYQIYQSHPCVCWYAWSALRANPCFSWFSFCGDLKGCFRLFSCAEDRSMTNSEIRRGILEFPFFQMRHGNWNIYYYIYYKFKPRVGR